MVIIRENVPADLTRLSNWVLWRYQERDGNPTKVPYTFMGYRASATNPEHWTTFECALKFASRLGFCDGIGVVFPPDRTITGIDLDDIWQSDADEGPTWARGIVERFANSYMEISPSGSGLKIWCHARSPRCGRWTVGAGAVEIYDHARFFAVTGRFAGISVLANHQSDVEALVADLDDMRRCQPQSRTQTVPEIIPQGQRHNTLISLAGTMWRRGMATEAIEAALLVTDQKQCDPPHGPEHIHKIVESMRRWER
jgi:hypothetical protein